MCSVSTSDLKTINSVQEDFRGLIVYDEDDTIPSVTLPMDIKLHCQQSNSYYPTRNPIDTGSLFEKPSNYNSDVFESIHVPQTSDIRSIRSQCFSRSYHSLFNN
jgi:hypothetical protein